jgi:acylaminoacyl-peptidase
VRFRKGEKNEKDLFIEVWNESHGFVSSKKISDKVSKVYNDPTFGPASWSKDESKIVFVGEKPEPAAYKNFWEDETAPKKEEGGEVEEKKDEKPKDTPHWQDEKFEFKDDFGETLTGKKRPTLFIFDVKENTINEVQGINTLGDGFVYPAFPIFDEHSKGIVFVGLHSPF